MLESLLERTMQYSWKLGILSGLLGGLLASSLRAELKPEEVAVIATSDSADSLAVARHYVLARKIPPRNVFLLKKGYSSTISRTVWNEEIRPEIRKWLQTRSEVRCVVCCWDVPLRIAAYDEKAPQVAGRLAYLQDWRRDAVRQAEQMLRAMYAIYSTEENTKEAESLQVPENITPADLGTLFKKALTAAQKNLADLSDEEQRAALRKVQIALQTASGLAGFYNTLQQQKDAELAKNEAFQKKLSEIRTTLQHKATSIAALEILPESNTRDAEVLRLAEQVTGLIGALGWLDLQKKITLKNESTAAFDSELSAIFQEGTPIFQWIPNYQSLYAASLSLPLPPTRKLVETAVEEGNLLPALVEIRSSSDEPQPIRPVLMVARLEAPSVEIVQRLIDQSLEVEKTGLRGTIYLDARGGRPNGKPDIGSYEKLDQSLHDLASRLKKYTSFPVKLEATESLLRKEDCPDAAALYCGWYSLAHYVDAFTFSPGAVAYHVASMEAVSLKRGKFWCPNFLSHGVCATLGPTFEPYLSAFPEPDEFYSLLMTGRYTMIECYYYTKPFNSWALTFVGDPLYNPFQHAPALEMQQLPPTLKKFFQVKSKP